jgi:hypothetical protein
MSSKFGIAIVGGCLAANTAWAGTQWEDTVSNCAATNCGAQSIRAVHQTNEPFVIQIFAGEGECLRLDVDSQTQDTALLIASPSVLAYDWVDDRDFDNDDFRPLYLLDPVPTTGWYTVIVSYFDWGPTVAKFVLKYGRYPSGNANCPPPPPATDAQLKPRGANASKVKSPKASATALRD